MSFYLKKRHWIAGGLLLFFVICLFGGFFSAGKTQSFLPKKPIESTASLGAALSTDSQTQNVKLSELKLESRRPQETKAGYFERLFDFGKSNGLKAIPALRELLADPDWQIRCAAMRALAATGAREAMDILESFVTDSQAIEQSAQATIALGGMEYPEVTNILLGKLDSTQSNELRGCILDGLSSRPYQEAGAFFSQYLASSNISAQEKGEVIASLGFHQEAPVEILVPFINAVDEDLRMGALEALATRQDGLYGQQLLAQISKETASHIREKIYEAAGVQKNTYPYQMAELAAKETDPVAKLRAQRAWGTTVGKSPDAQNKAIFDQQAVPELLNQALNNSDPGEQKIALQALAVSNTLPARDALVKIAEQSGSPRLSKMAAALARQKSFSTPVSNKSTSP